MRSNDVKSGGTSLLSSLLRGGVERFYPRSPTVVWLPATLVAGAMVLPLVYLVLRAQSADSGLWDILVRFRTLEILGRSTMLVAAVTGATVAIAVPIAWLTVRTDIPLRRFWSVTTALPLVIPSYIGAFTLIAALAPRGIIQQLLESVFGIERLPDIHGFWGATLALSFLSFPYVLLPVRAAIRGLDPGMEESARGLGYSPWGVFHRVTLPQLRPAIVAGALLVALYTLSDFGAVSLLRYETFTWAIYLQYESVFDRSVSAGLSLILVALALGILLFDALTRGQSRYVSGGAGGTRPLRVMRLGPWRWPALIFCGAVVLTSLGGPMSVLIYWVVRGVSAGESLSSLWGVAGNSLYVSALASVACIAAALPVAILAVRYPSRFATLIERVSYLGFALPGVVVALALVFFGANYVSPVYQTLGLLVLAYMILFLPPALGAIRAQLLQVDPRMEEAARGLGLSPLRAFISVTFPLIRGGMLAGAALVFLITMKELPATLILGPIGFETLATKVWGASEAAFFAEAAFPALLLILLSSVPMALLVLSDRGSDTVLLRAKK
ncbi:MAG: iron ABC transporter permease [Chloroflexi bacterium]|nr:iron ABC transporter permease [Chloroflexota bacterium]